MGEELVSRTNSPKKPYTDTFNEVFYLYIAMGMTEEQFWDKDVCLVKHYQKAQALKNKQKNEQAWLNGLYTYEAISKLSPILHAFAKEGTKAGEYVSKPYPITEEDIRREKEEREAIEIAKFKAKFESWAIEHNVRKKHEEKH